jgi:hypothetical protein
MRWLARLRWRPLLVASREDWGTDGPMKNASAYVVYSPPMPGFPFLAVTLKVDGRVTAKRFDTAEAAAAFNKKAAQQERH